MRFLPSANSGPHVSTSGELLEMGREVHEHAPLDHRVLRSAQYCELLRVSGACKTGSEEEVISAQGLVRFDGCRKEVVDAKGRCRGNVERRAERLRTGDRELRTSVTAAPLPMHDKKMRFNCCSDDFVLRRG